MTDKLRESKAVKVLQRAVELEEKKIYTAAIACYEEGIRALDDLAHTIVDKQQQTYFSDRLEIYNGRLDYIQSFVSQQKQTGFYHEECFIEHNNKGFGWDTILGRFLNSQVTKVEIQDPYIRTEAQVGNFVRLCEVLLESCDQLKELELVTSTEKNPLQVQYLDTIQKDLLDRHKLCMKYSFSTTLHDRQIKLNNGWLIKIGRGLDFYKEPKHKYSFGQFETEFLACRETHVDIFFRKVD